MTSFGDVQFYYLGIVLGQGAGLAVGFALGYAKRGELARRALSRFTPAQRAELKARLEDVAPGASPGRE